MSSGKPIGLVGGVFDPVHVGHTRIALECVKVLDLDRVNFIPANVPPHKTAAMAAATHRLAMLERALQPYPSLVVDDVELRRGGISYTIDTLSALRAGNPQQPLCFIMGSDAFATLPTWRRWQELTDYAHLAIIDRPPRERTRWEQRLRVHYAERACASVQSLHTRPCGHIYRTAVTVPAISSSRVRALLGEQQSPRNLLPPGVYHYIRDNRLYA